MTAGTNGKTHKLKIVNVATYNYLREMSWTIATYIVNVATYNYLREMSWTIATYNLI